LLSSFVEGLKIKSFSCNWDEKKQRIPQKKELIIVSIAQDSLATGCSLKFNQ
jgi:hypothetical protein